MKRRFLYSEAKLAQLSGISRTDIIKLRKEMKKGRDWRKSKNGKGGSIELSEGAVQIVLKTFGLTDTDPAPALIDFGKNAKRTIDPKQDESYIVRTSTDYGTIASIPSMVVLPDPPQLKLLKVTSLPPNKRIVKAVNGTGEIYDVIVPSNLVWAIGDPLTAKQSKHHGYLELVGKAPRWRGDRIYTHTFMEAG